MLLVHCIPFRWWCYCMYDCGKAFDRIDTCSVLSKCPHLTLTSLSESFFISSVDDQWFFRKNIIIDTLSYKVPLFVNDFIHIGLDGLKVRMRGIIWFLVLVCSLSRSAVSLMHGLSSLGPVYILFWISAFDVIIHSCICMNFKISQFVTVSSYS